MIALRLARSDDHDALVRLWETAGLGHLREEEWRSLLGRAASFVLVAEDGLDLVGAAVGSFDGWRAYLYHVAVAPAHRRRGLAKRLMAETEDRLARAGAHRVYVMVQEKNTAGLALSGAMGYEPEGEMVLVKELAPSAVSAGTVTAILDDNVRTEAAMEALLAAGFREDAIVALTAEGAVHPHGSEALSPRLADVVLRFAVGEETFHALRARREVQDDEHVLLVNAASAIDRQRAARILRHHGAHLVGPLAD